MTTAHIHQPADEPGGYETGQGTCRYCGNVIYRVTSTTWTTDEPGGSDLLEQEAPAGCAAVQDLYSWSLNYDDGKDPFSLFVDLIYDLRSASLGYVELGKLSLALRRVRRPPTGRPRLRGPAHGVRGFRPSEKGLTANLQGC